MTQAMTPEAVEASWSRLTVAQQDWWKGFFDNARYIKLAEYKLAKPYPYDIHMTEVVKVNETKALDAMRADIEKKLWGTNYTVGVDPYKDNTNNELYTTNYDGSWLVKQEAKMLVKERENYLARMRAINNSENKFQLPMAGYIQNAPKPQQPLILEEMFEPTKSKAKVGDVVLVYPGPGQAPIEGIIKEIDMITGIILSVILKDGPTKDKVISVKNKVVLAVPIFYSLFKLIKSWFKKRN